MAELVDESRYDLIDDGICLFTHLIVIRVLDWVRDEDTLDIRQAERLGLSLRRDDEFARR